MPRINQLVETTTVGVDDFYIVETVAGTRKVKKSNTVFKIGEFPILLDTDVSLFNDFIWIWDATTGTPKRISVRNLVFGDFDNISESNTFTLDPGTHGGGRPVQCTGTFATPTIFLNGNLAIEGTVFALVNFSSTDLTVQPTPDSGVSLRVNGVSGNGTLRVDRAATIICSNGGGTAVFSGG